MKKKFKLQDLDCANCAAKIERGVAAIDGVSSATVNFLTTKLIFEAEEDNLEEVVKKAKKVIRKIEPDVEIKEI